MSYPGSAGRASSGVCGLPAIVGSTTNEMTQTPEPRVNREGTATHLLWQSHVISHVPRAQGRGWGRGGH